MLMIEEKIYPRDEFLRLVRMKSNSFNQRSHQRENALGWGLRKPIHQGEYGPIDAIGMLLTSMFSYYARIDLKSAADVVTTHWLPWTRALAAAERNMDGSEEDYFAVGVSFKNKEDWSKKRDFTPSRVTAGFGKRQAAVNEVEKKGPHDNIIMLPLQTVVRALHANAESARPKIELPKMLCPAPPDSPEFDQWVAAKTEYLSRTDKAKGRKPKVTA
jgi:hypothetical protein